MLENDTAEIMEERDKQLKLCPFCGEAAHLFVTPRGSQVVCTYCHAGTTVCKGMAAIREWDRRG